MVDSNTDVPAMVVTIDGPAGAGKTSVSKLLARRLGYRYIDTGALYRGIALAAHEAGIASDDDNALAQLCQTLFLDFVKSPDGLRLMLDERDITDYIRTPQVTMMASAVSARPAVRDHLLEIQRTMGAGKSVVLEGRDMGTVVFPDAEMKFFLDADPKLRARRRFEELQAKNVNSVRLQDVEKDMLLRDKNDRSRSVAPLKPAEDAIRIDSTQLTIEQVVAAMLDHIRAKWS
ncbi:MAG: (d)CMP kinase [Desulfobacteraceae bacterium]|jgi:cytidylate kinase